MTEFMTSTGESKPGALPEPRQRPSRTAALSAAAKSIATPMRSASALASSAHQVLHGLESRRVPRLGQVRERVQQAEAGWDLRELEQALHALQEASAAVDFLPGRGRSFPAAEFRRQAGMVGGAAKRLAHASLHFIGRHAAEGTATRLLWAELMMESRAIDKRVRQGLAWLREMEQELATRRAAATAEVSQRALQELGRRGEALADKLHLVQGVCGAARAARNLGDQAQAHRSALGTLLQEEVRPASVRLQQQLQALVEACDVRAPEPAQLLVAIDSRHALEVAATRAAAELQHLQALQGELATQLGWMAQKEKPLG
ncbi:MAG TPA: hypothetical protein VFM98_22290 [Ramlibacter sp.]|uniref:hypothetical protein n=1 Tax=Ramlibacter sp. TaxID=1917967 RepID=UPI002D801140|nr:hypothetical protein [Ramlibacter sp.]HET8748342.1 hypothetical protein [Ramlibacter sp.]